MRLWPAVVTMQMILFSPLEWEAREWLPKLWLLTVIETVASEATGAAERDTVPGSAESTV